MIQDIKAINLLREFVREKLGGDIRKLKTFDFTTLDEDRKYGATNHPQAPIVKAIMVVAFGDVWPELSMNQIDHGPYKCDTIQTYQNLFGINMCDQYFKGMQYFKPTDSQFQRALRVAHLTYSVGNFWVLPGNGAISNRILDNSYRYYMDKFLKNIYAVLTEQKRVDKTLQKAIENAPQMKPYYGVEGFQKFVHDMMLEDYVDYYGKPMDIFDFVWSSMRGLDRDKYFKAVDQYCSFCEKTFVKRADKIIEKLEEALRKAPTAKTSQEQSTQKGKLTRYALEFDYMLQSLDFSMNDKKTGLPLMANKDYFVTLYRKMGLVPDGFGWDEFSIEIVNLDENHPAIIYTFPKPQKEPEAIYGAIVIDHQDKTVDYFTLEKGRTEGRWALGYNNPKERILIGLYDISPSKDKFYELIMGPAQFMLKSDINAVLTMPTEYQKGNNLPEDPDCCVNFGSMTSSCATFIQVFPIGYMSAMDFGNPQSIIDGIHKTLADNQALIEVRAGMTKRSYHYIYSIVKTKRESSGVQYFLLMQIMYGHVVLNIKAFFDERGMTGVRDTTIWELAYRDGIVSVKDDSKWWFDPYDKNYKHPWLMNLSEKEEYDKMFPEHPLSQCREFANYVMEQSYLWKKK